MSKKITLADIYDLKSEGKKFSCLTCYDYTTARLIAETDTEMILVGDSAAQAMLGFSSTLPIGMDIMVAITAAARRGAPDKIIVADMPFLSYQVSKAEAIRNAGRFITEAGADVIKIECTESQIDIVKEVSDAGMAVMAHIGIRPQSIGKRGVLKAEGTRAQTAMELVELADKMLDAGAAILLLEGTSREVAKVITERTEVPVLSCGAGPDCDGQVLVISDVLGFSEGAMPKFAAKFGDVAGEIKKAASEYTSQVKAGTFPADEHSYHMKKSEMESFMKKLKEI